MGLGIYLEASADSNLSEGDFTRPFPISFDGRIGGIKEVKLYLRNDDAALYYTDILLGLEDTGAESHVDGTLNGFEWKIRAGDLKPTNNEWAHIDPATSVSMANLGSSSTPNTITYLPFWVLIKVPRNVDVQTIDTIKFVLTGSENLI